MKKVLVAFDGTKYSHGAIEYALQVAARGKGMLVGVFLHDLRYLNMTYAITYDHPFVDYSAMAEIEAEEKQKIDRNIQLFRNTCQEHNVHHKVHLDKGVPLQELLRESAFADLIILDSHLSFFTLSSEEPSPFVKDVLHESKCPVLIVPPTYHYFDNAVVCYDASASSVHAMKMFSYVFPELDDMKTTLLSINESSEKHLRENINISDLALAHFRDLNFEVLKGEPEKTLIEYLTKNGDHALVVMGAYGRNAVSRFLHQSLSNKVIELNVPVFIAHQ